MTLMLLSSMSELSEDLFLTYPGEICIFNIRFCFDLSFVCLLMSNVSIKEENKFSAVAPEAV